MDTLEKLIVNPDVDIVAKIGLVVGRGVKVVVWERKACFRNASVYNRRVLGTFSSLTSWV